ncbi:hypothetical protein A0Y90_05890 [Campylobacter upsaliensis]|nr:hypothetical protein [Campylobacter upsaliensis]
MEYKGLSIIPKIEEYAVQFCLISKDDYRHGLHLGNFSYRKNYYEDTNSMIEPKSLRMSKDMFFNDIGFDYFTKRIDNFVKDIDKHLQEERQNHNKIVADKEQSKNLLEQNQGGFAKQELLNALKKDRDTIIEKIQNKEKDWIPSYKMLHQKNVEKEQELNYN